MRQDPRDSRDESFAVRLEALARGIAQNETDSKETWSPRSALDDQIRLTLHQSDQTRARSRTVSDSILRNECYVGTELRQMEDRTPRYSPYRFPEREKLQRRLSWLAKERRRLMITEGEKLDTLHDRLLELLGKRRLLTVNQQLGVRVPTKGLRGLRCRRP